MKTAQSILKEIEAEFEKEGLNFPFINFKEIGFKIDKGINLNESEKEVVIGLIGPVWAEPIASLNRDLKNLLLGKIKEHFGA